MRTLIKTLGILVLPLPVSVRAMELSVKDMGAYDHADALTCPRGAIDLPQAEIIKIRVSAQFAPDALQYAEQIEIYDGINNGFIGALSLKNQNNGRYEVNDAYPLPTGRDSIIFRYKLREINRSFGDRIYDGLCDSHCSIPSSASTRTSRPGEIFLKKKYYDQELLEVKEAPLHAVRLNIVINRLVDDTEKSPIFIKPICLYSNEQVTFPAYCIVNFDMAKKDSPLNNPTLLKSILATVDLSEVDSKSRPYYVDTANPSAAIDEGIDIQRLNVISEYLKLASKHYSVDLQQLDPDSVRKLLNFMISQGVVWSRHIATVKDYFNWR